MIENQPLRASHSRACPHSQLPLLLRSSSAVRSGRSPNIVKAMQACLCRYLSHCFLNMPAGIRTPDTRLRRPVLYPAELRTHSTNVLPHSDHKGKCYGNTIFPLWLLNFYETCQFRYPSLQSPLFSPKICESGSLKSLYFSMNAS